MSAAPPVSLSSSPVVERTAHALLLALAMPILLAPAGGLSWLVAGLGLLLAAWPLALAERALSVRARKPLLSGMQVLTREADAGRGWRVLAWSSLAASLLALALMSLLAGAIATQIVQAVLAGHATVPDGRQLWPVLTLLALLTALLRPLGKAPVLVWLLPATLLLILQVMLHARGLASAPVETDLMLPAVLPDQALLLFGALALGGGLGVHWQLAAQDGQRLSLPGLGMTLVLALAVLAGLFGGGLPALMLAFVITLLAITALLQPALALARERGLSPVMALILIFVPTVLMTEAIGYFGGVTLLDDLACVLAIWMTLNLLVLSIYAGWVMKVSHVRKALQLPSEAIYNVWRVAVRWVAPIILLSGLAQLLRALFA